MCGNRLTTDEKHICVECIATMPPTGHLSDPYENRMAKLLWGRLPVERVAALFFYQPKSTFSNAIIALKYHGMKGAGVTLGRIFARQAKEQGFFDGIDYIIPMPIARKRERWRGYNQSVMIARGISEVSGISVRTDIVKRTTFKASQTNLRSMERWRNVEGAFTLLKPNDIAGRHVLLVDDVMTTGATIIACGEACMAAGDVRFSIMTLGFTTP